MLEKHNHLGEVGEVFFRYECGMRVLRGLDGVAKGLLMRPQRSKQLSRSGCALCLVRGLHSTLIPKKYFSNLLQGGCVSPALINLGVTLLQSLYDSRLDNMPKLPELLCN